jgi:hypothetical protein
LNRTEAGERRSTFFIKNIILAYAYLYLLAYSNVVAGAGTETGTALPILHFISNLSGNYFMLTMNVFSSLQCEEIILKLLITRQSVFYAVNRIFTVFINLIKI